MCVILCVPEFPSPATVAKLWLVKPGCVYHAVVLLSVSPKKVPLVAVPADLRMPSRQERRTAERDAAKAAKAGAAVAAAALAHVRINAGGDWKTQAENPCVLVRALGAEIVKRRAGEGDREAQWSQGSQLMCEADGGAGMPLGSGGRSPKADVGVGTLHRTVSGRSPDRDASWKLLLTKCFVCGFHP